MPPSRPAWSSGPGGQTRAARTASSSLQAASNLLVLFLSLNVLSGEPLVRAARLSFGGGGLGHQTHTARTPTARRMATSELAVTYAALILHDDGLEITADNLNTILKAANITVEPYWPSLFAKLFAKKSIGDLITNVGAGASLFCEEGAAPPHSSTPRRAAPRGSSAAWSRPGCARACRCSSSTQSPSVGAGGRREEAELVVRAPRLATLP